MLIVTIAEIVVLPGYKNWLVVVILETWHAMSLQNINL
jgi:hypothetical protein